MSSLYVVKQKKGNTYDYVAARCQHCLGSEFVVRDEKAICMNCGKEYIEEKKGE